MLVQNVYSSSHNAKERESRGRNESAVVELPPFGHRPREHGGHREKNQNDFPSENPIGKDFFD